MDRRKNFRDTVSHKVPEKMLVDLWGCPLSGISDKKAQELDDLLGFNGKDEPKVFNLSERAMKYYEIDTRGVGWILAPKQSYYKRIAEDVYTDEWGVTRKFTGLYWDIVDSPLKGKSYDEVKNYVFPDPQTVDVSELKAIRAQAKKLKEETDYVICGSHPVYGVFELACWMFGFEDFLMRMALEPETVHMFFERVLDYQREISDLYYGEVGEYLDFTSSGDDFATQASTFFSKEMFDEMILPYFKERIRFTKAKTSAKFLHHSCGNVFSLIPSLVEAGVDILNPVQPVSAQMQAKSLKEAYGQKIVFHGGFDTQQTLVHASPEEIDREVRRLISDMGHGSGSIFAAAHCIQDDVPAENVHAMLEAAKKYSKNNLSVTE